MATTDKLNQKILQKAEDELLQEVEKFVAILDTKASYRQYEYVDLGEKGHETTLGLGNKSTFKFILKRMVYAAYLQNLHTKKVNTVLKQFEI
jgi:hypothetical protein